MGQVDYSNDRAKKYGGKALDHLTDNQWRKIKAQYKHRCLCCHRKFPDVFLTIDHIVPLSKGGKNLARNVQPLCEDCNKAKGDQIIDYRPFKTLINYGMI